MQYFTVTAEMTPVGTVVSTAIMSVQFSAADNSITEELSKITGFIVQVILLSG